MKEVKAITYSETKRWFLEKHYAKRIPSVSYAYGLYLNGVLEGVISFGTPASSTLLRGVAGEEFKNNVLELNRLVLNSTAPFNSASFLIAKSIRLLPKKSIIVSYADTGQNHNGYVYQASNFIYTGLSAKFSDPKVKGLEHQHHCTYAKGKTKAQLKEEFGERLYYVSRSRKHRYVYFRDKRMEKYLKYPKMPYPKQESKKYECIDIREDQ